MDNYKKEHSPPCHLQGRVRFLLFSVFCLAAIVIVLTTFLIQFYGKMITLEAKLANLHEFVEFVDQGDVHKKDSGIMPEDGDFFFVNPKMWSKRLKRQVDDADDLMWMSSSAKIPTKAIQSYCQEAKTYCAASGPPGKDGAKGDKGDKGDDGLAVALKSLESSELEALRGPPGKKGEPGIPGLNGISGEPGEKGDKGDGVTTSGKIRVMRGPPGPLGPVGPKGDRGEKGDKGDDGIAVSLKTLEPSQLEALRGPPGVPGKDGLDGLPGLDGIPGDKGEQGFPGIPGLLGEPGREGLRGERGYTGSFNMGAPQGDHEDRDFAGRGGYKGDQEPHRIRSADCEKSRETNPGRGGYKGDQEPHRIRSDPGRTGGWG